MAFIAAQRHERISTPWVIDGPIIGELFTLYIERVLARPSQGVNLSFSTISPVTKARRRAMPFAPLEPICSSCRRIAPTSIRSSRASPSSDT